MGLYFQSGVDGCSSRWQCCPPVCTVTHYNYIHTNAVVSCSLTTVSSLTSSEREKQHLSGTRGQSLDKPRPLNQEGRLTNRPGLFMMCAAPGLLSLWSGWKKHYWALWMEKYVNYCCEQYFWWALMHLLKNTKYFLHNPTSLWLLINMYCTFVMKVVYFLGFTVACSLFFRYFVPSVPLDWVRSTGQVISVPVASGSHLPSKYTSQESTKLKHSLREK